MKNYYLAVANNPAGSPASNIQIMGWDISVSTLITAIIGAILGAILAQWLSHVFSTKREDQKYYREVFQELYLDYIHIAALSYSDLEDIKVPANRKITSLEIAKKEKEIMAHVLDKAKYADAQMIFWASEYNYRQQRLSQKEKCIFFAEFISYMYLSGAKGKLLSNDLKYILLKLLSISVNEFLTLETKGWFRLKFRYQFFKWHFKRVLFYR